MKVKAIILIAAALLLVSAIPVYAQEVPPLPHAFYGTVEINDEPAPVGTKVEARGEGVFTPIEGNPIVTTEAGKYGGPGGLDPKLVVQGDIEEGATITFYVNGVVAESWEWHSGDVTELDLSVTIADGAPPPPPGGTTFTSSALSISPTEVDIGEEVTISVLVTNTGNASGSYEVTLKIDGVVVASEEVTLAAGASEKVTFTTAKDVAGSYSVAINGLTGSFTVRPAPISPAPPPVAPAPPDEVTPAPAPPVAPPAPPSRVNWAVVGPIIAVAVFLAIFLSIRQRRRRVG